MEINVSCNADVPIDIEIFDDGTIDLTIDTDSEYDVVFNQTVEEETGEVTEIVLDIHILD